MIKSESFSLNIPAYTFFVLFFVLWYVFWKEICLYLLFRGILYKLKYISAKEKLMLILSVLTNCSWLNLRYREHINQIDKNIIFLPLNRGDSRRKVILGTDICKSYKDYIWQHGVWVTSTTWPAASGLENMKQPSVIFHIWKFRCIDRTMNTILAVCAFSF